MDNAKEMSVIFAGLDFAKRGINTLAIDGPGQAETLRLRNIHSRYDYEVPGSAAYDYVAARAGGRSETRRGHGLQLRRLPGAAHRRVRASLRRLRRLRRDALEHLRLGRRQQGEARGRPTHQLDLDLPVSLGGSVPPTTRPRSNGRKSSPLKGVAQNIICAFLVLHGENDRIVPLSEARTLYDKVGSTRKHIKIFTAEDGGAEHCQVDNRQLGVDYIGDWLLANM